MVCSWYEYYFEAYPGSINRVVFTMLLHVCIFYTSLYFCKRKEVPKVRYTKYRNPRQISKKFVHMFGLLTIPSWEEPWYIKTYITLSIKEYTGLPRRGCRIGYEFEDNLYEGMIYAVILALIALVCNPLAVTLIILIFSLSHNIK